jgi:hypothetical protein
VLGLGALLAPASAAGAQDVFSAASFWNTPLPPTTRIDGWTSTVANDLHGQAGRIAPYVNTKSWSAQVTVVPPGQPLVPVRLLRSGSWALTAALQTGLPIPPGWEPQSDRDRHGVFYQPDYVGPTGLRGRYYEVWRLQRDASGAWTAEWGGRMISTATSLGYFDDWLTGYGSATPGDPDSTYRQRSWGATATSLPLIGGIIRKDDCERGRINHALGLSVIAPRAGYRWPAQRGDGSSTSTSAVQEGMRLRFPPSYQPPATLHPFARMIAIALRDHGAVVWDQAGSLSFRAEPSCSTLIGPTPGYAVLRGFEWSKLKLLVTGSAANPNPH